MKSYRVSTIFSQRELLEFLDHNLSINVTIQAMPEDQGAAVDPRSEPAPEPIYKPERMVRQRRSKVIDTIMSVLQAGSAHPNTLKAALVEHGMSETSLAGGLSLLQRENKISRAPDGQYVSNFVGEAA